MDLYGLIKNLRVARQNGFVYDQITKLTMKFRSHFPYINISYYQKSKIPMSHRQFFKVISQNLDYVENFCDDLDNPFHFAIREWINQLKQKLHVIL